MKFYRYNRSLWTWTWTSYLFHTSSPYRTSCSHAAFAFMPSSSFAIASSSLFHDKHTLISSSISSSSSSSASFSSKGSDGSIKSRSMIVPGLASSTRLASQQASMDSNKGLISEEISDMECFSTLTLLEHINLNVPNHDYILDFYIKVLGMGLDPRRAQNVVKGSGTVWVNCGASQFHLPFGEQAQVIPGSIGLWYDDLNGLKDRLEAYHHEEKEGQIEKPFSEYAIDYSGDSSSGGSINSIRIVDRYGNVFYCRRGKDPIDICIQKAVSPSDTNTASSHDEKIMIHETMRTAKQPVLTNYLPEHLADYTTAAQQYGVNSEHQSTALSSSSSSTTTTTSATTECKGISYVEFLIPRNTAAKIAEFYDGVLDATTSVYQDPMTGDDVAIVAFGSIQVETGRSSQCLLFRETDADIPPYDGHHIALYVGKNQADFEQAFKNAQEAQVVWVNPRFSDKATNLNTAKKWKQFRFKNITDLETGKMIFELEHEVRSVTHEAWPGNDK